MPDQNDSQPAISGSKSNPGFAQNRCFILRIPAEMRVKIYDMMFFSRENQGGGNRGTDTAIMYTCRQIHKEAAHVLYAHRSFDVDVAEGFLEFRKKIGHANFGSIRSLNMIVPREVEELNEWLEVLDVLAESATGLRHLKITWNANYTDTSAGVAADYQGLGDSMPFVRSLARLHSLNTLSLCGNYGKPWKEYLTEKMGIVIKEESDFEFGGFALFENVWRERGELLWNQLRELDAADADQTN